MPIYEYEPNGPGCPKCQSRFEVFQSMNDPPLTECPDCRQPVHRVFSPCAVTHGTRGTLSPKNLSRHGFTQYRKAGGGYYEKTCGEGPDVIKRGA